MHQNIPSSEHRIREHENSTINHVEFDGTMDTLPWRSGETYEGRTIISIAIKDTVYGKNYDLVVEGDRTHVTTRFTFNHKHDLIFTKPLERPTGQMPKNFTLPQMS